MKRLVHLFVFLLFISAGSHAAIFTVTNANDSGNGSLRWAITSANTNGATDTIMFNIPGAGPHVIDVVNTLPQITAPVSILGDTQPGYAGTPLIEIHGPSTNIAIFDTGISCASPNITVRALRITGFRYAGFAGGDLSGGVFLQGCVLDGNNDGAVVGNIITVGGTVASNRNIIINNATNGILVWYPGTKIYGNYIGVAADGVTPAGNGENGIRIQYTRDIEIKGGPGWPQVISGSGQNGIYLAPNGSYVYFCSNITVQGNFIGTDASGMNSISNYTGIYIWGGSRNTIGGTTTNLRNVISGNSGVGLQISGISILNIYGFENKIHGNYIGLAADGETVLPNYIGVSIYDTHDNTVGGSSAGQGNRFGASDYYHVRIHSTYLQAYSNRVEGNWFGLSVSTQVLSGAYSGVHIGGASNNVVGGTTSGARNYFAGVDTGVSIEGTNSRNNQIIGNWFGVKPDGTYAVVNSYGIEIYNARNNEIGGTTPEQANTISGCQAYGVRIHGPTASGNIVQGNNIGSDPTGTFSISNRYAGVDIANGAHSNRIGATNFVFSAMNVISGNEGVGVAIRDSNTYGNVLSYNFIGLTRSYDALSNNSYGVNIFQSPGNQIGPANLVGNSQSTGINIAGSNAVGNVVIGNVIGSDGLATRHPNSNGIGITGPETIIGGVTSADRNYIGGNRVNGVDIGNGGHGTVIQGNYIGLDAFGTAVMSNSQYGVYVNNANSVVIGGLGSARNIISGSRLSGVVIAGSSSNTVIAGNYIGTTENGLTRIGNGTSGISVSADYTTVGVPFAGLGNVVVGGAAAGIEVSAVNGVRIRNNSVGIGADGVTNISNARGIVLGNGSRNVQVGGTNALDANVIARNSGTEVWLQGSAGNRIEGNYIGVMNFGVAFPSGDSGLGMDIENSPSNWIYKNVIGQVGDALRIIGSGSENNIVRGNYIGEYNLEKINSSGWGIYILNASGNIIGGQTADERNLIAHNSGGILVTNAVSSNAVNNLLSPNLVYSNRPRLNIDLGGNGFSPNDPLDTDSGPNNLQNSPVLTNSVTLFPGLGIVYAQGILTSAPLTTYAIDIYRSGSTNAEGRAYYGRTYMTTDAGGVGSFSAGLPVNVAVGTYLAATATDPANNTSEFSASPTGAVLAATGDSDGDLIPNYWETLYGLNPAVSNAVDADADSDGVSDLDEYIADTPANDGTKYLAIDTFFGAGNGTVVFPSSSLRVYRIEDNGDLTTNPAWSAISGYVTGQFGSTSFAVTNGSAWDNYRVGVKLP